MLRPRDVTYTMDGPSDGNVKHLPREKKKLEPTPQRPLVFLTSRTSRDDIRPKLSLSRHPQCMPELAGLEPGNVRLIALSLNH